ncbi:MAG: hypothetical protein A2589_03725 [Candidatus Vogelbacteria bacterium RIFOXYD1_FULL_46_19]|uniref:DUF1189 domain-containing protein n=1 Tax=Candidatus Vogelbacteria bacterium RIFOXYD1_FULL_46_19 TaxID=1802439 RepID=A0A1G2QHB6_9BACT|nr:MAG: hypothetical protein A2589_03725 [Candidatus Vogelbacteria bacterium RIFOXYD1_FULL_46_19]
MNFLKQIGDSIYSPVFYRAQLVKPAGPALVYYFKLILALALVLATLSALFIVPNLNRWLWQIKPALLDIYPDNLVVTVENGEVATNQTEAVAIAWPTEWQLTDDNLPTNFMIIDPSLEVVPTNWKSLDTLFLIGSDFFASTKSANMDQVNVEIIPSEASFMVNETNIGLAFSEVEPWFKFLGPLVVLLIFIGAFLGLTLMIIPLLLVALFTWLLILSMKKILGLSQVGYWSALGVTLHASTTALLWLVVALSLGWAGGLWWLPALTLLVVYINLVTQIANRGEL